MEVLDICTSLVSVVMTGRAFHGEPDLASWVQYPGLSHWPITPFKGTLLVSARITWDVPRDMASDRLPAIGYIAKGSIGYLLNMKGCLIVSNLLDLNRSMHSSILG